MNLFVIIYFVIGLYSLYQSIIYFVDYSKTKEDSSKQRGTGFLLILIVLLLGIFTHKLPIPPAVVGSIQFIIFFIALSYLNKARRLQLGYKAPVNPVNGEGRLMLNGIIILSFIFLSLIIFLGASSYCQQSLLINKGQEITAIITRNDIGTKADTIEYQFNNNGVLVRRGENLKGIIQGRNADDFKKGDRIQVLVYNGQSTIKGCYQSLQPMILFVIGMASIFIWAVRKRFFLAKQ